MNFQKCEGCGLWDHRLREGLCTECYIRKTRSLCPKCEVYLLREGKPCPCEEEGVEEVRAEEQSREQWIEKHHPLAAQNDEHIRAIFHYYGDLYNHHGPVKEIREKFQEYISENHLSKELVDDFVNLYHDMYGC